MRLIALAAFTAISFAASAAQAAEDRYKLFFSGCYIAIVRIETDGPSAGVVTYRNNPRMGSCIKDSSFGSGFIASATIGGVQSEWLFISTNTYPHDNHYQATDVYQYPLVDGGLTFQIITHRGKPANLYGTGSYTVEKLGSDAAAYEIGPN
jgi:hypothetical protein